MNTNLTLNGMSGLFLGLPPDAVQGVLIALAIVNLIVVFLIAVAVKNDAENLSEGLFLVSPWMWFVIVLATAYVGALAYWLIHYSSLRFQQQRRD
jgi:hypothetical protein